MRMPSASRRIHIGMMWPPQRPKTRSTPRARRMRAMTPAPESAVIGGGRMAMSCSECRMRGSGLARQPVAQHAVQDLARRRARHFALRHERDCARALVAGHLVAAPREHVLLVRALPVVHDDYRVHGFAPFLVRHPDD